ncbi:HNH endonuclease [Gluconobacter morbifer]|uniref:HNH endonuclease n=1 Tax=Gluconobacter morbifer TaxID=479935 RepID=UPI0038CD22F3
MRNQQYDRHRGSASARGYDRKWQAFRKWFLIRNPLCHDCRREQLLTPATEVHHIQKLRDAPDRRLDATNCMALCHSCHSTRTACGE